MLNNPDLDAVDEMIRSVYVTHGYVAARSHGKQDLDEDAVKDAVYAKMVTDHVVGDLGAVDDEALTANQLYRAIFPRGPGAGWELMSAEELEVRKRLLGKVWGYTNTGVSGYCQKRAELEGRTYLLCEAIVTRTYPSEEPRRPEATMEPGRFFTNDGDVIVQHGTSASSDKLAKVAEAVATYLQMVVRRHPEVAAPVARQVAAALDKVEAALAQVAADN